MEKVPICVLTRQPDLSTKRALNALQMSRESIDQGSHPLITDYAVTDHHVTIINSGEDFPKEKIPPPDDDVTFVLVPKQVELWDNRQTGRGISVVLTLHDHNGALTAARDRYEKAGIISNFKVFKPHVSLWIMKLTHYIHNEQECVNMLHHMTYYLNKSNRYNTGALIFKGEKQNTTPHKPNNIIRELRY